MDKKLFGTRINKARKDRGLTAEKLAEACNINSTYLRQIEGGKKLPSLPVFATLCRELRVSPNYILPDLVEGTEAEKIQKIFSESDPTPSQIEMLAEMAGVILKERYNAMGFPPDYIIDRDYMGNPYPKNEQVARCGNAVCPPMAAAVARANFPEYVAKVGDTITTMAALLDMVAV